MNPFILTNFKNYKSAIGDKAIDLAKIHYEIKKVKNGNIAIAVNAIDIKDICKEYSDKISIFAQHSDAYSFGSSTGKILPEYLKEIGVKGVILNHSENRFSNLYSLVETIKFIKEVGLKVVCCIEDIEEGEIILKDSDPDFVAIEPPELIGGNISVSIANPELIKNTVKKLGKNKVLVGAGIKTGEDVKLAIKYGAQGVLLASGITKSKEPKKVLIDLIS
jgi:triosephosphate isomerase